ncbi:right-handed parallel beta-helix repeat-containing protein [Methylorubrum podarium]|jgi:hypothetical protein|uniref:right-handed parallel beta-helix repeat-containing protein n=1 Tax=Methylorubrum podarium TaxID=200476 RepID=UPI001EE211F3|nr:right-handed parallel beta-helix repeat-containing protein [Methylorubrum podarium]GJE69371.1 hypothetical protein CHKEEEPN_0896 [Methylorubrum podarium]
MKRLFLITAACLAVSASAFAQAIAVPPKGERGNADITAGDATRLGRREAGKTIITPDTLQILGSGSTGDASTLSVAPSIGGAPRALKDLLSNETYAANFGVVADDGLDDGPALREALRAAQMRGTRLRLPPGVITVCPDPGDAEALLRVTSLVEIAGASRGSRIEPCEAAGGRAVILVKPLANAGGIRGAVLRDFSIGKLGLKRFGGDGIRIDTTNRNGFVAKLLVENVSIADAGPGKWAVHHTNDPAAATGNQTGGLFASTFRDNDFFGGMKFEQTGDSNNIERNIITGPNVGIDYQAIVGAATHRITGNNITAMGGAIIVRNTQQVKITENQLEMPGSYTGSQASPAMILIENVADWVVADNNINAGDKADIVVARNNARGGRVGPNTVSYASGHYLYRATGSPGNSVERQHSEIIAGIESTGRSSVSIDPGSITLGVWQPLVILNGWSAGRDKNFRQGLWWMPMPDGSIRLSGTIQGGSITAGTAIATFPGNYRPPLAHRLPVLTLTGAGAWQLGVLTADVAGNLGVQNLPANTLVQFDGTSFSIRP